MKRFGPAFGFVFVLMLAPAVARADLSLRFGDGNGPLGRPVGPPPPPAGPYFVDLVFVETGTPDDEGLFAYDIGVDATPGGPVRLVGAQKPDNWVFTNRNASLVLFEEATPSRLIVSAADVSGGERLKDVTTGMEAARILYTIDCDAATRLDSTVSLDREITAFASGDPNHNPEIPVDVSDAATFVCPEPAGLIALPLAAALGRRRRRRPA
jgi:hypothetical protein